MPNPLVQALMARFDSEFEGPNGDYSAVLETVASLSVTEALWKPTPSRRQRLRRWRTRRILAEMAR
jgi:hypothetical protein